MPTFSVVVEDAEAYKRIKTLCAKMGGVILDIEEDDAWFESTYKQYDACVFLEEAKKKFDEVDLIQTGSNLWLAAVYAIKQLYYEIGIQTSFLKELTYLVEFALVESDISKSKLFDLLDQWKRAQEYVNSFKINFVFRCHNFTYGGFLDLEKTFDIKEFPLIIDGITTFVKEILVIDPAPIRNAFVKFQNTNDEKKIKIENVKKKFYFAKKEREVNYVVKSS